MIGQYFRPWGELHWLMRKLPAEKYDFVGCLSTEDRFISGFSTLLGLNLIGRSLFFKILDPPSKDTAVINDKIDSNYNLLLALHTEFVLESHSLLEPYHDIIASINTFLNNCSGNIVLDVSTFPKRFFFPILKILLNRRLRNLILINSTPKEYCVEALSGNPQSWEHLPLFMPVNFPDPSIDVAIVGVGFMPFGLPELLLSKYNSTPVKLLFPFPPGPPNYQRTWDFVRKIQRSFVFKNSDGILRLDSNNMPAAYDIITRETNNGELNPIFAPYGPKPFSIAMAIYATLNQATAYYTQPTHYNPGYSTGVKDTFGYAVVLNDQNLYQNNPN